MIGRVAVILALTPALLCGADAWVIRGVASTPAEPCFPIFWDAYAIVHNATDSVATLRLLHASNGVYDGPPITRAVPARQTALARDLNLAGPGALPLWVDRLDVPDGVVIEGRLEQLRLDVCAAMGQPPLRRAVGKVRLPVFRRLVSAGEEQVHYGTDLGSMRARMNVAIYNASSAVASAVMRVEQPLCTSGAGPATTAATIPPDTIVQVPLGEIVVPCPGDDRKEWASRVIVTVDQPSLSLVSTLSNEPPAVHMSVNAH